jgi:hypothetical protein
MGAAEGSTGVRRGVLASIGALALLLAVLLPAATAEAKGTVWLCKPGLDSNPCKPGLSTTTMTPTGEPTGVIHPKRSRHPKFDCFYVYPTVSDDEGSTSDRSIDPEERSIALYQASRYSQRCRVFAPMYRQVTLQALFGGEELSEADRERGYKDVRRAFRTYLKRFNNGRGVVLIGHSQGTVVLRALLHDQVDGHPGVQRRIISAILLGGNVLVDEGKRSGSDLKSLGACKRDDQTRCAIAFSTYDEPVPDNAIFGRPSPGFLGGDPATQDVLCTNPAALGGGEAKLDSIIPSEPFAPGTTIGLGTTLVGFPQPDVDTTYVEVDGAYRGACESVDDSDVLQIEPLGGAPDLNELPDATWGLHLIDANIALGNLIDVVASQARAYLDRR